MSAHTFLDDTTAHDTHDRRVDLLWLALAAVAWVAQLVYLISPIDLMPDFLPVIGWADDILTFLATSVATGFGAWKIYKARSEPDPARTLTGPRYGAEAYEPLSAEEIRAL